MTNKENKKFIKSVKRFARKINNLPKAIEETMKILLSKLEKQNDK